MSREDGRRWYAGVVCFGGSLPDKGADESPPLRHGRLGECHEHTRGRHTTEYVQSTDFLSALRFD